jgi:hypothetical protein
VECVNARVRVGADGRVRAEQRGASAPIDRPTGGDAHARVVCADRCTARRPEARRHAWATRNARRCNIRCKTRRCNNSATRGDATNHATRGGATLRASAPNLDGTLSPKP